MFSFRLILLLVSVLLKLSDEVKINLQGSLSLGNDVLASISHFVVEPKISGRRSFGEDVADANSGSDTVSLIVNSAFLCRDIIFCKDKTGKLINKYIIALTETVETVFEGLIDDNNKKKQNKKGIKVVTFEAELRVMLLEIKNMLINIDEKIADLNKAYTWLDFIKIINARFQDRAIRFASQRLEGNPQETSEAKKKLTQKLTIATSLVELQFESRLCSEHDICSKSHECSKALNTLLEKIKTVADDRAKEFVRNFYETLPGTNFYNTINEVTGHEFQSILYDMAYADDILTLNVLSILQKYVEDRLNLVASKFRTPDNAYYGRDVKLVHIILSDMDHFYNKPKREPFHEFLSEFYEWAKRGGRFSSQLRRVMKDIQDTLTYEADELVQKLFREVRVFMEVTVDPVP